jgi:hypothetical protein
VVLVGIERCNQRMGAARAFRWSTLGTSRPAPLASWPSLVAWSVTRWWLIFARPFFGRLGQDNSQTANT